MTATPIATTVQSSRVGARYDNASQACDSVNGNSVANDGRVLLLVVNGAGAQTLTVQSTYTADSLLGAPTLVYNLAANQSIVIGGFPKETYGTTLTFTASASTVSVVAWHR